MLYYLVARCSSDSSLSDYMSLCLTKYAEMVGEYFRCGSRLCHPAQIVATYSEEVTALAVYTLTDDSSHCL